MQLFRNVWKEAKIDIIGKKGGERSETTCEGEEDFEESVESVFGIFKS